MNIILWFYRPIKYASKYWGASKIELKISSSYNFKSYWSTFFIFKVDCICDDLQQRRDVKTLERFIRMFTNATAAQTTVTGLENDCGNVVSIFWILLKLKVLYTIYCCIRSSCGKEMGVVYFDQQMGASHFFSILTSLSVFFFQK